MINALANHHVLPHSGKGITKEMAVKALVEAINLDPSICNVFASVAVSTNPDHHASFFDLNHVSKHGVIEHDVSLSRNDVELGDNTTFDPWVWEHVLSNYGEGPELDFQTASKARYERVLACQKAHESAERDFQYGIKELILSYGETALMFGLLGKVKEGKLPLEYVKVLVGEYIGNGGLNLLTYWSM
jgi:hypothetical protein